MKYKVCFSGFHYVEADSPEEVEELAMYMDESVYSEQKVESITEVEEFSVRIDDKEE